MKEMHAVEIDKAKLKAKQISSFTLEIMEEVLDISKRLQLLNKKIEASVYSDSNPNGFLLDIADNYNMFLRLCKNKLHKKLEEDRKSWENSIRVH